MTSSNAQADSAPAPRQRLNFNADWRFHKADPPGAAETLAFSQLEPYFLPGANDFRRSATPKSRPAGNLGANVTFTRPDFDDSAWRRLDLPHDWGVDGAFEQELPGETGKLSWAGVGWYRKTFASPASDAGRRVRLEIDGAMAVSAVWLNGQLVGGWPYGYASYQLDLTPFLKVGAPNVLAIRLDNAPRSSRWYPGGGIYRNVWLTKTAPLHVAQWGTFVTTPHVSAREATIDIETTLQNSGARRDEVRLVSMVLDADGQKVAELSQRAALAAGQKTTVRGQIALAAPRLWSLKDPYRYRVVSRVMQGETALDEYETPLGIRSAKWDAKRGFLLNGEPVPIQGVCQHHDLGALGTAINVRALERQIEILQEMGCNAIRTSHNPPAPELLELCDRMGILVMDELVDVWKQAKTPNDYHTRFETWAEADLRALIRRDRNHPSVILWSTGNEVHEQSSAEGAAISQRLTDICHDEDPTRFVSLGANNTRAGYNGFQKTIDVFGYNYKPFEYARFHAAHPDQPLIGSETASAISSRGEYFFPVSDDKSQGRSDFQVSSYDLYAPSWAMPPDTEFKGQDENPFVAGEFVWTGFDYIGEPTPYSSDSTNLLNFFDPAERARAEAQLKALGKIRVPSRSSYFGIIDLAGFKKDRFYLYQAQWHPDFPMAHILPHWNWPERSGQITPVHVYTSGDEAELFLNGRSLGRKKRAPLEYRLRWDDVIYQPGELRVVAYKNGQNWVESSVKTTKDAAQLLAKTDRATLRADGTDLAFVTVSVADAEGLMVPRAKNRLSFSLDGPGEIVATDNGDATDLEAFKTHEKAAFNGLALAIVRTKAGQSGPIRLRVTSPGLKDGEIVLTAMSF